MVYTYPFCRTFGTFSPLSATGELKIYFLNCESDTEHTDDFESDTEHSQVIVPNSRGTFIGTLVFAPVIVPFFFHVHMSLYQFLRYTGHYTWYTSHFTKFSWYFYWYTRLCTRYTGDCTILFSCRLVIVPIPCSTLVIVPVRCCTLVICRGKLQILVVH